MNKLCSKCKTLRPISEFSKLSSSKDGHKQHCKMCIKDYNYKNREHIRTKCKLYRINNLEKERQRDKKNWQRYKNKRHIQHKLWYINNKQYIKEYYKRKMMTDVNFRLATILRSRIRDAIKKNNTHKSYSSINLLGCSIAKVRKYLESKFQPGMSWKNHGLYGWHIDHIKACAKFNLKDPKQQRKCFHYTNLQPLWAKDNLSKGDN